MLYTIYICVINIQLSQILIEHKQCFLQIHTLYTILSMVSSKLKSSKSSDFSPDVSSFCSPFPEVIRVSVSWGVCTMVSSISFSSFHFCISPSQSSISSSALFGMLKSFSSSLNWTSWDYEAWGQL